MKISLVTVELSVPGKQVSTIMYIDNASTKVAIGSSLLSSPPE
jgi:hypothetical protein